MLPRIITVNGDHTPCVTILSQISETNTPPNPLNDLLAPFLNNEGNLQYTTWLFLINGITPAAAHLLRSWVRLPPGAWIFVCCECCVFSGRGLCDELIAHPEESYRLCCVLVCDLETSRICTPYIYDISHLRVKLFYFKLINFSLS
jgi:hypothetical protein